MPAATWHFSRRSAAELPAEPSHLRGAKGRTLAGGSEVGNSGFHRQFREGWISVPLGAPLLQVRAILSIFFWGGIGQRMGGFGTPIC
jgi:hypothetical protein